jgi:hypothetical protein
VCTGTKEDESSTGHIWAAGLHHVTARSRLARGLKTMNRFFNFPKIFSGHGKLRIRGSACTFIHSFIQSLTQAFSKRILTAKLAADCAE